MDETLQYIQEARTFMESYVDISLADMFFESDEEVKAINENNEKAKMGALGAIKKAIETIIKAVKDAMERLRLFLAKTFMTKDEKAQLAEIRKAIKENPELGKEKVDGVVDFKEYDDAYDEALKDLEAEAKKDNFGEASVKAIVEKLNEKITSIKNKTADMADKASLSITLDTALEIADRNYLCANAINTALKLELISLDDIAKTLGEKEAKKFEKKIERYAKDSILHKAKVMILRKKQDTFTDVLKKQTRKILSFTNICRGKNKDGSKKPVITPGSVVKGMKENPGLVVDTLGGPKEAAKAAATVTKATAKTAKFGYKAYKAKKNAEKRLDEAKNFFR